MYQSLKTYAERIFHISEVHESRTLQLFYIALIASFTISFHSWNGAGLTDPLSSSTCLPHIEDCQVYKEIFPLSAQPSGYSENIWYVFLFIILVGTSVAVYRKQFIYAHIGILLLFLWKAYIVFGISTLSVGNYDYYDIALAFIFLFAGNKLFFLRLVFVLMYFLSSTVKIHDGWIVGTYFTSLSNGIPFFSTSFLPIITNLVTLLQIIFCWFLLAPKSSRLFKFALFEFLLFHFYSGTIVAYRYIISSIPPLVILFGHATDVSYKKGKSWVGFGFILCLFLVQFIGHLIPGDQKLTLEGNRYGFYMFDANHQCIIHATYDDAMGGTITRSTISTKSRYRCEVDMILQQQQRMCVNNPSITLQILHSINGGPFYKIVDEKDMCSLTYRAFEKNSWIMGEYDALESFGYPIRNTYEGNILYERSATPPTSDQMVPKYLLQDTPQELTHLQIWLRTHLNLIERLYWSLWIITGFIAMIYIMRTRFISK